MIGDYIFVLIISLLFLYSYITTQNQFTATASAIRQIWSGGCRLSCRQSEYSEFSGLSSLQPALESRNPMASQNTEAENSHRCTCESCPCALIENFLRSCRPASNISAHLFQYTANCISYFIQMFVDAYEYCTRVFDCNSPCQQTNQVIQSGSSTNFSFSKEDREKLAEKLMHIADCGKNISDSDKTSNKEKNSGINVNLNKCDGARNEQASGGKESTSEMAQSIGERRDKNGPSNDNNLEAPHPVCKIDCGNIIPTEEEAKEARSKESTEQKGCLKCVEKGRTCVKECPKAKGKK